MTSLELQCCCAGSLRRAHERLRACAEEQQILSTNAKGLQGLVPKDSRLGVRALLIAELLGSTTSDPPFMHHHRVVPGGQTRTERGRVRRTDARSQYRVQLHVRPHEKKWRTNARVHQPHIDRLLRARFRYRWNPDRCCPCRFRSARVTLAEQVGRTGGDVASRRRRAHHLAGQPPGCDVHAAVTALLEAGVERRKVDRHDLRHGPLQPIPDIGPAPLAPTLAWSKLRSARFHRQSRDPERAGVSVCDDHFILKCHNAGLR